MKKNELKRDVMQSRFFKETVNALKTSNINFPLSDKEIPEVLADYILSIPNGKLNRII